VTQQAATLELCVLLPAYNEAKHLPTTLMGIYQVLVHAGIAHNILVVNDHSTDESVTVMGALKQQIPTLNYINNAYGQGFGNTVRYGLDHWKGDVVAIVMADASDSPEDLLVYYRKLCTSQEDCVFGSRFMLGSNVVGYPAQKLFFNRTFNLLVRVLVDWRFNDFTNAFKLYRREVIDSCRPYRSHNFSLTLEIPLKALSKGFTYTTVPISWTQRKYGHSNLNLWRNARAYLAILTQYLLNRL
jgi:dolichol-phosphate mannosyltransferase